MAYSLRFIGLAAVFTANLAHGQTIWTGPVITFQQHGAPLIDTTQATNQDRITPNVWLTRANSDRLFNAKSETFCSRGISPADTAWATGTLNNATNGSLTYTDFNTWVDGLGLGHVNPKILGVNAVVHLVSEDIYLSIKFTGWVPNGNFGSGGGFTYERSTPAVAPLAAPVLSLPNVSGNQFTFDYTANPGSSYVIENSSNLVNWLPLATNIAISSPVHFTNSFVPNGSHYFRVGRLP